MPALVPPWSAVSVIFGPPLETLCGQEAFSHAGTYHTSVGTVHSTLRHRDNRDQFFQ